MTGKAIHIGFTSRLLIEPVTVAHGSKRVKTSSTLFTSITLSFIKTFFPVYHHVFLSSLYREKDQHISKLSELQRLQSQQAEHALEDFKAQVERNSSKMFDDMKKQVSQL